jgi:SpoIVB peptidase S55
MEVKFYPVLTFLLVFCAGVFAQTAVKYDSHSLNVLSSGTQILPLDQVKEGMHGVARTVFRGSEPEEFNVEILGVVPGAVGPKQDMIIGRLSGGGADRTSVFAGMSGSPVYIDGRLVGSISYSFPFSKEPICGITPIEQMIAIFESKRGVKTASNPKAFSFGELASTSWKAGVSGNAAAATVMADSTVPSLAGLSFQPIATPLSFNGFSQETLNMFSPQLMSAGLMPVASVGGAAKLSPLKAATADTLLGGTSVSMALSRGDYSMVASGTVTLRDGDKIYAFGHPFLSLGTSDLPMTESHVVAVVPNMNNSFKLAVPDAMVGAMTQDRNTGVFGKLGQAPKMIPVSLTMTTSRGQTQTYNYEVVKDEFLTPLLLNITIFNSIASNERGMGDATITLDGTVDIKGEKSLKLERRFTGGQAGQSAAGSVAVPVSALLRSGFDNLEVKQINLNVTATDGSRQATLERVSLDKTEVKAGDSFEVQAFIRSEAGQVFVQRTPVKVPDGTPAGSLIVSVGDGGTLQQVSASRVFVPKTASDLISTINDIKKSDRLYVQTYRVTNGAIIGSKEMPNLPPSVLATLNNDRTAGGITPTVLTVLTEQEIPQAEYIISGQQVLTIDVTK